MEEFGDVVLDKSEFWITFKIGDIFAASGNKIVDSHNFVAFFKKLFAQIRTYKTRPASN